MDELTKNPISEVFAMNLTKYRQALGLSREKFAEKIGISRSMQTAIEKEEKFPSLTTLTAICTFLNIEAYKLFLPESRSDIDIITDIGTLRAKLKDDLESLVDDSFNDFLLK